MNSNQDFQDVGFQPQGNLTATLERPDEQTVPEAFEEIQEIAHEPPKRRGRRPGTVNKPKGKAVWSAKVFGALLRVRNGIAPHKGDKDILKAFTSDELEFYWTREMSPEAVTAPKPARLAFSAGEIAEYGREFGAMFKHTAERAHPQLIRLVRTVLLAKYVKKRQRKNKAE